MLPALGDVATPPEATDVIEAALMAVAVPATYAPAIAARLMVDHPLWGSASWFFPASTPAGGRIGGKILQCDEPMSPRCGVDLAIGISEEQMDRLADALGTAPSL